MLLDNENLIILKLLTTKGVGKRTISRIIDDIEHAKVPLVDLEYMSARDLSKRYNLDSKICEAFLAGNERAKRLWAEIEEKGSKITVRGMRDYPSHLFNALGDNAPPILFYKGNPELFKVPGIGFCGSRKASNKGRSITRKCAWILAENALNVVSGYAYGVDLSAHRGALEKGGTTTIVLAEGILRFRLKSEIKELVNDQNTLIVSEFLPNITWQAHQAMERNQTIIGLSNAMILVESDNMGGTFNAGQATLKYHRPLFVIDYEQPPASAKGNTYFIQRGAQRIRQSKEAIPNLDKVIELASREHKNGNISGPKNGNLFEFNSSEKNLSSLNPQGVAESFAKVSDYKRR